MSQKIYITDKFECGNIEVESIENTTAKLNIRKDYGTNTFQWFYFRASGVKNLSMNYELLNAGKSSYPDGWENYKTYASYDRQNWFRVNTSFDGKSLKIEHKPEYNVVYYAYHPPYTYERTLNHISQAQQKDNCKLETIGHTYEGRALDMLTIGNVTSSKKKIWVIARQHPGESMASWFIEGMLDRLLDKSDPVSRMILKKSVFYVVPNVNIDGTIAGNLRMSLSGENLNRAWENPDKEKTPEIYYIRKKMDQLGLDLNLDVHGDEGLPYNFVAGAEENPNYPEKVALAQEKFIKNWMDASPDFQDTHKYPIEKHKEHPLRICTNQITHRFSTLSLTIEMPFKDNADLPDAKHGWSGERSMKLGKSVLFPVLQFLK